MSENDHNNVAADPAVPTEGKTMASKTRKERSTAEKSADFRKLASKHAGTAIGAVRRLAKLARPGRYHWTPGEIKILEEKFSEELGAAFALLKNPPKVGKKVTANIFD